MKNEHQENGVLRDPLILMVHASNLVAAMSLDWLDQTDREPEVFRITTLIFSLELSDLLRLQGKSNLCHS